MGGTIAHGYLTLSLIPARGAEVVRFDLPGARLNYGADKVRFPAPSDLGEPVRAHVTVQYMKEACAGLRVAMQYTIEIEGESKAGCVAETLTMFTGTRTSVE